MKLKFKLNLLVSFLLVMFMLGGLLFNVYNARDNVKAEVESTEKLTLYLFDTAILRNQEHIQSNTDKKPFNLKSLKHMRHVRIEYYDTHGVLTDTNRDDSNQDLNEAPRWMEYFIGLTSPKWSQKTRLVRVGDRMLGRIEITPDPRYEYAEIWKQMKDAFILIGIFFVLVNLLISFVVNYALRPTSIIYQALQNFGEGNLEARLPEFDTQELKGIGEKFNEMAGRLQHSVRRNHDLSRQLISLQEEERKSIARDLHDEFGQSLTAIQADSQAALTVVRKKCPEAISSIEAINDISKHLMKVVNGLLRRIRPQILDELGLEVAIEDLVDQWRLRYPHVHFNLDITENSTEGLSEPFRVAIFRMVQECLTNISRHAEARLVFVGIQPKNEIKGQRKLRVRIEDDGCGFDPEKVKGFGLAGMRERLEGLGAEITIQSSHNGTLVSAIIPFGSK